MSINNDTRSIRANRPLSPHLTIYKLQISSFTSIAHRISGFALYIGFILLTWFVILSIYFAFNKESTSIQFFYSLFTQFFSSIVGNIFLFGWSVAFFYHMLNGIRHLFWDAGYGLNVKTAYKTGWVVILTSILLTLLTWYIVIF